MCLPPAGWTTSEAADALGFPAWERMVLSVPPQCVDELLKLARDEDVEATVIGTFGTESHDLVLRFNDTGVARLSMDFLHNGLPMPHHPVFGAPRFALASRDRFFLCIEATDPRFDEDETWRFLQRLQPRQISEVER